MEKDITWSTYFEDEERFADFVNCFGCDGRSFVGGDDIHREDSKVYFLTRLRGRTKGISKVRDVVRRVVFGVNFCIVGIENQETIDYAYPLREWSYTLGTYESQRRKIARNRRKQFKGKTSVSQLLYGFGKENRLKPTVTFLLYAGTKPWDGSLDLHGMLDFTDIPNELRDKVSNYRINLIEISKLSEEQICSLRTDLRNVFQFIRYAEDKQSLLKLVESDDYYKHMDEDAYMVVANYTHSKEMIEEEKYLTEGGKRDMCKAILDLMADSREEGWSAGRTEGEVHSILVLLQRIGTVPEELQKELSEIKDEEMLQKLLIEAATTKNIKQFRNVLDGLKSAV